MMYWRMCFKDVKHVITTTLMLQRVDPTKPFVIEKDAMSVLQLLSCCKEQILLNLL